MEVSLEITSSNLYIDNKDKDNISIFNNIQK